MRLRQLQTTQSVTFFAPLEVDMSIRDTCDTRFPIGPRIESQHVIFWLLEQTCRANEDLQPLFQAQGTDFCRRTNALLEHPKFFTSFSSKYKLVKTLQQQEHQTLEQLYGGSPTHSSPSQDPGRMLSSRLQGFMDRLSQYQNTTFWQIDAFGEVEQEREVEVQLETEREVQRPVRYQALGFPGLSSKINDFLNNGKLDTTARDFIHVFDYIGKTKIGKKFGVRHTGSRLFVSREFEHTIVLPENDQSVADRFLVRPIFHAIYYLYYNATILTFDNNYSVLWNGFSGVHLLKRL